MEGLRKMLIGLILKRRFLDGFLRKERVEDYVTRRIDLRADE